jgi:hypothetical protein
MPHRLAALLASLVALAPAALAVVPVPPDQVAYSGYVAGVNSPQLIEARIYDAASGGTLVPGTFDDVPTTRPLHDPPRPHRHQPAPPPLTTSSGPRSRATSWRTAPCRDHGDSELQPRVNPARAYAMRATTR